MLSPTGLPTTLSGLTSFIHRGRLYIIGGHDGSPGTYYRKVLSAGISSQTSNGKLDVQLSGYQDAGGLPIPVATHAQVFDPQNNRVYVIGGTDGTDAGVAATNTDMVFMGVINPSGSISWSKAISGPPIWQGSPLSATYWRDYMFVGGAIDADTGSLTAAHGTIWKAKFNRATGDIGAWAQTTPVGPALGDTVGTLGNSLIACSGLLFSVGGQYSSGPFKFGQILWSRIAPDGTVGPWNTLQFPGSLGRAGTMVAADSNSIYIAGGYDATVDHPEIFQVKVVGNVPQTPVLVGGLMTARDSGAIAFDGKTLFISGGENFAAALQSTIEIIKVK